MLRLSILWLQVCAAPAVRGAPGMGRLVNCGGDCGARCHAACLSEVLRRDSKHVDTLQHAGWLPETLLHCHLREDLVS